MSRREFELDRTEAKLMGVCAGLGNMAGVDPTIVRIAFVVATLIGGWWWVVAAYFALGLFAQARGRRIRRAGRTAIGGGGHEMRDLDRRLAEIDSYVAGSNGRLAREIEDLR